MLNQLCYESAQPTQLLDMLQYRTATSQILKTLLLVAQRLAGTGLVGWVLGCGQRLEALHGGAVGVARMRDGGAPLSDLQLLSQG